MKRPRPVDYVIHKPGEWGFHFRLADFRRDMKEYVADVNWRRIFRPHRKKKTGEG